MGKLVKCKICGKQIDKDDAYVYLHTSKTGKQYKWNVCSLEEVENDKREKELYKLCQYETDAILGREITNNARNKELSELHEQYSWEQILRCIRAKADDIKRMIEYNNIEGDYAQIRYVMQVIKNCIYDFTREDEKLQDWEQYKQEEEEISEEEFCEAKEESDEEIINRLKEKKDNKNNISSFLNGLE